MSFHATLGEHMGDPSPFRKQFTGHIITINPNIIMSKDDPEMQNFRNHFSKKIQQLYTRSNARKYVNYLGDIGAVNFSDIDINVESTIEYGKTTNKLHVHTRHVMSFKVPRGVPLLNRTSIGIDFNLFHQVVADVFHEPFYKSTVALIRPLNMTDANLHEYFEKGHYK